MPEPKKEIKEEESGGAVKAPGEAPRTTVVVVVDQDGKVSSPERRPIFSRERFQRILNSRMRAALELEEYINQRP